MSKFGLQLMIFAMLLGCAQTKEMDENEAREIAHSALREYCEEEAVHDCAQFEFVGVSRSNSGWLVEYRSDSTLQAVLVRRDGTTELSRFIESD